DPLVVTGHRYDGTATGERAAEHPVRRDGLHTGVDRPGPLVLRPGGVQPPPRELETPLHLALVVDVLPHDRGFGTWRDRVDRLPLTCTILARRKVSVQEPGPVELQAETATHSDLLRCSVMAPSIRRTTSCVQPDARRSSRSGAENQAVGDSG